MITLQTRHRAGHNTALARQGNIIGPFGLDRGSDGGVVLVDDGSVDSAPTLTTPLLATAFPVGL